MKEAFIPRQIFDAMTKVVSCELISLKGTVKGIIDYDSKQWVITGSCSSGVAGYMSVTAHQALELENYEGKLRPLDQNYSMADIMAAKPERGYHSDIVKYQGRSFVLIDPNFDFKPVPVVAPAKVAPTKGEIKIKTFRGYDGGKSGDGTYQTLINHTPPHDVKIIPFAGLCGLTRHISPARLNIINDLDTAVVEAWETAVGDRAGFRLFNVDAIEYFLSGIAKYFDTAATFIYLDPPYRIATLKGGRRIYKYSLTDEQHLRLLEIIKSFKHARIMLSAYQNEMYDEALAGWHQHDFLSMTNAGLAMERIYMNYQPGDELHDYSYIGKEYREREKLARIKKNFIKKLKRLEPRLRNAILTDIVPHKTAVQPVNAVTNCDRIDVITTEDFYKLSSLAKFCGARWKQRDLNALICDTVPQEN